jgi:hypothetical protein
MATKTKKDIVTIICYGKTKQMERAEAIKKFSNGVLCCEGSEQSRYANILAELLHGYKVCTDGEDD